MVFIWRGAGIIVPIFVFISGWVTSYWFEDTRLGNPHFMGWTLLWSGIVLTLTGLALFGGNQPDPETGEVPQKSNHDFFWIPVIIWGIAFIGLSIWLVNKELDPTYADKSSNIETSADTNDDEEDIEELEMVEVPDEDLLTKPMLNIYNSKEDTLNVVISDKAKSAILFEEIIPPLNIFFQPFEPGTYTIKMNKASGPISIPKPDNFKNVKYYSSWLVLGNNVDLILVDVTQSCRGDINKTEMEEIEWKPMVIDRFDGANIFEVLLTSEDKSLKYTVYRPGISLPIKRGKNETVFSLIPIPSDMEVKEEYLDSMIVNLCF